MKTSRRLSRNAPCPCKSGRRFKHCHGANSPAVALQISEEEVREMLRAQEAEEILRKRQQGYGRPMVTVFHAGFRIVAVGNRLAYSKNWRFFPDFLLDNMKHVIGPEWCRDATRLLPDHPIVGWLALLEAARRKTAPGKPIHMTGGISALGRFCYALYLIEHNDKPSRNMLRKLRHPAEFDPTCYEALVASAFALAGARIDGAEDGKGNQPKPEFFATFSAHGRFAVEAKRKRDWKVDLDFKSEAFEEELRAWLRGKLHAASKKELTNPVYWFELGIGKEITSGDATLLHELVGRALEDAESLTVKGNPAQPAYVVVTNNSDFANSDISKIAHFAVLQGFRMENFREGQIDLETAFDRHDAHRPILRVLECLTEVQQIPNSFEGIPDELLDESGAPIRVPKLGDTMRFTRPDGSGGAGRIEEITAAGGDAWVIVKDEDKSQRPILSFPLSPAEANAASKFGNAIFGKPEGPQENITDPVRLYDRMLEVYGDYPHESLMRQIRRHPRAAEFQKLSREALLVRVAREITKSAHSTRNPDTPGERKI